MSKWLLGLILIAIASCSVEKSKLEDASLSCAESSQGYLCVNGSLTPQLDGMCQTSNDCPPPYNQCDESNRCQIQAAQAGSNQIWFATDPIRPGIHSGDAPGPSGTGYIYNIMAKGYESLDDWCMSQAQLSSIGSMRKVASWTAMVLAQPDRLGATTGNSPSEGLNRFNAYGLIAWQGGGNFFGPDSTSGQFSSVNNTLQDRNGIPASNANQFAAWSGLYRAHPGETALMCVALANSKCVGGDAGASSDYWGQCGFWDAICSHDNPGSQNTMDVSTVWWGYQCGDSNAWSNSGSPSGSPTENDVNNNGGIFALTPANCSPTPGFDFLVTCNYDSPVADLVGSFCSNAHPILCLSH
ncbi:MAG: hypothetical protein I8H75_05395 [Myxococcaceae bacterium]|nr:hypothetical protein [Myxococcaceae bacterium]